MNLGAVILTSYFGFNKLFKLLFFWLLIIGALLWVIGSLTHIDRLIMFMVGAIVATIALNWDTVSRITMKIVDLITDIVHSIF